MYAAVNEVKAVSPPPDAGTSRTRKNVRPGVFGVKVCPICHKLFVSPGDGGDCLYVLLVSSPGAEKVRSDLHFFVTVDDLESWPSTLWISHGRVLSLR